MIFNTRGIVLRAVKYGETSLIVSVYTSSFGLQSYIVNGVRINSKKSAAKANHFQPAAILEMEVYHNELRNLQRIKEFRWAHLYNHIFFDVVKNAVALFMVELLSKCIRQPETHAELFDFIEDAFLALDEATDTATANLPLFFALHLAGFFGLRLSDDYMPGNDILDLHEGIFTSEQPSHKFFLEGELSFATAQVMKAMQPHELEEIKLNGTSRRALLQAYENFYAIHVPDFGSLKTLPVLQAVLS